MARCLRVEYPGAIYHVSVRTLGSWRGARQCLFEDDADRERFLERLAERVKQYEVRLYLFCLMTNHVHLVLETPQGNLSGFMQSLSTAYTVYFNLRHTRHGHLLQGRYKAKVVEGTEYLLKLSRYVHLNPVQVSAWERKPTAERVAALRKYAWSSYPSYIGRRKRLGFVEYTPLLKEVGGRGGGRLRRYRAYVEGGLVEQDEEFEVARKASTLSIGSDVFQEWVLDLHQGLLRKHKRPEDVGLRRARDPLTWAIVLHAAGEVLGVDVGEFRRRRRNSNLRAIAAHFLCRYATLTQRQAAQMLGMGTGAAVSRQLRMLNERLPKDRRLRELLLKMEKRLENLREKQHSSVISRRAKRMQSSPRRIQT